MVSRGHPLALPVELKRQLIRLESVDKVVFICKIHISMPCVYEAGGLKIYVYDEKGGRHHRSHVHAVKGEASAVFSLDAIVECLGNDGFSKKGLRIIGKIVEANQEVFFETWGELNDKK